MITTEQQTSADRNTVHGLLVEVDSWRLWSPHVASVEAPSSTVHDGWHGRTRAFFSPGATDMIVSRVTDGGGYDWHSTAGPWRLDYQNRVEDRGTGSVIRFTAELSGPAAGFIERLVAPASARGQRRRIARLAQLAELIERTD